MFDFNKVVEEEKSEDPGSSAVEQKKDYLARFDAHKAQLVEMQNRAVVLEVKDKASAELAVTWGVEAARLAKEIKGNEEDLIEEPNKFISGVRAAAKRYLEPLESVKDTLRSKIRDYQARVELERRKTEEIARHVAAELQRKLDAEAAEANRIALESARKIAEEKAAEEKKKAEEGARKAKANKAEMERIAREAEDRRLILLRQAEADAAKNAIKAPEVPLPLVTKKKTIIRGEDGGSSSLRKEWKWEAREGILNEIREKILSQARKEELIPIEFLKIEVDLNNSAVNDAIKMGVREIRNLRIWEDVNPIFRT